MNKTLFLALFGVAAGTGAALMLMSRNRRNAIASDARLALDTAADYAADYLPATGRSRRNTARPAAKRKLVKKSRRTARAA